jgi:hypothetical protein
MISLLSTHLSTSTSSNHLGWGYLSQQPYDKCKLGNSNTWHKAQQGMYYLYHRMLQ